MQLSKARKSPFFLGESNINFLKYKRNILFQDESILKNVLLNKDKHS